MTVMLMVRCNEKENIMARVKIEKVCDKLDHDLRRALAGAVRSTIPGAQFDEYSLFREFVREVGRKCRTWERIPDQYVETE